MSSGVYTNLVSDGSYLNLNRKNLNLYQKNQAKKYFLAGSIEAIFEHMEINYESRFFPLILVLKVSLVWVSSPKFISAKLIGYG